MTEILALKLRSGETFTVVPHVATEMLVLAVSFALLGIALGTPAGDLRSTLGDPLVVESSSKLSHTAAYLRGRRSVGRAARDGTRGRRVRRGDRTRARRDHA